MQRRLFAVPRIDTPTSKLAGTEPAAIQALARRLLRAQGGGIALLERALSKGTRR